MNHFHLNPRDYPGQDVYGVLGNPVAHSLSPKIHAMFAQQANQNIHYGKLSCDFSDFQSTVETFFSSGGRGLNITIPFKSEAYVLCEHLTPRAKAAGVINILWQEEGHYWGDNSDGFGLVRDLLNSGVQLEGSEILVLGAGGAVQGVILPLLERLPTRIYIANRSLDRAQVLLERFTDQAKNDQVQLQVISLEDLEQLTTPIDIVINGTSTGLLNTSVITDQIAQKLTLLNSTKPQFAYDMVYGKQTTFLKQFTQLGFQTQDGLGMLVEQAAVSFELWRDLPANSLDTQLVTTALRT